MLVTLTEIDLFKILIGLSLTHNIHNLRTTSTLISIVIIKIVKVLDNLVISIEVAAVKITTIIITTIILMSTDLNLLGDTI